MDAASWLNENGIDQWGYLHTGKENHEIEEAILKGTTYVVVDEAGKFVASFNLASEQNDWDLALWSNRDDPAVYLHRLVVARNQHNRQIGKELLVWMVNNVDQKVGSIRLDCVGHNKVLNNFYLASGFTFNGTHDMDGDLFSKYERIVG